MSIPQKSNYTIIALLIGIIFGVIVTTLYNNVSRRPERSVVRQWEYGSRDLGHQITPLYDYTNDIISNRDILRWSSHHISLYEQLNACRLLGVTLRHLDESYISNEYSKKADRLHDIWGNEIYYLVSKDGIIACMSAGPNKIWDRGKGDDMAVDTNMNLSKVLPLPDPPNDSQPTSKPIP